MLITDILSFCAIKMGPFYLSWIHKRTARKKNTAYWTSPVLTCAWASNSFIIKLSYMSLAIFRLSSGHSCFSYSLIWNKQFSVNANSRNLELTKVAAGDGRREWVGSRKARTRRPGRLTVRIEAGRTGRAATHSRQKLGQTTFRQSEGLLSDFKRSAP